MKRTLSLCLLCISTILFSQTPNATEVNGYVFEDANLDGIFNEEDVPIPGIEVWLSLSGEPIERTNTDESGQYKFFIQQPGNYSIIVSELDQPCNEKVFTIAAQGVYTFDFAFPCTIKECCKGDYNQFLQEHVVENFAVADCFGNVEISNDRLDKCHQVTLYFDDGSVVGPFSGIELPLTLQAQLANTVCMFIEEIDPATGQVCFETEVCTEILIPPCPEPCSQCFVHPNFSWLSTSNPITVNTNLVFSNQSIVDPNCAVTSLLWTFGNGQQSNEQSPVISYKSAGSYEVCLTLFYESFGQPDCSNTTCQIIYVEPDWQNCDSLIVLDESTILTTNIIKANKIIAKATIPQGEKVRLDATESVKLDAGFTIKSGATLQIGNEPCNDCAHDVLFNEIGVNSAFEQEPPLASRIAIEILAEETGCRENIRFVADLADRGIPQPFHAVLIDDEKFVLRDDGQGADLQAGDGLFSVFLQEDVQRLQEALIQRKNGLLQGERLIFNNRSIKPVNTDVISNTDLIEVFPGRILDLPRDFFLGGRSGSTDPLKTLLINDLGVVEDPARTINPCTLTGTPNGVWTFEYLMRHMASPAFGPFVSDANLSAFVKNWLNTWMVNNTINGELLAARTAINTSIIQPWINKSFADGGVPFGELKMKFAPFKLLAIVNRVDLRGSSGYGFSSAGEGRLVFCALDEFCNPLEFTVIFEYGVNIKSCVSLKAYAQEWADLDGLTPGSLAYNLALANITKQFTDRGTNMAKPNGNSLNQIRTNENALTNPWELREFNLAGSSPFSSLNLVPVKQEPAVKYNMKINNPDVVRLVNFINTHVPPIKDNKYTVPLTHSGQSFLGGKAHTQFPPTGASGVHHWDGAPIGPPIAFITSDEDRHVFSLNTCSGCHGGETQTFFTHIDPTAFGTAAGLSGFLTGEPGRGIPGFFPFDADGMINSIMTVNDPAGRGAPHQYEFNDLARREADLDNLLSTPCGFLPVLRLAEILTAPPIRMAH